MISEKKRESASQIWESAFERFGIQPDRCGQHFKLMWSNGSKPLSDELVYLADVLWGISCTLTEKSEPLLSSKIRGLLAAADQNNYLRCLSELEVPALLASRVSPIAWEPAVPLHVDLAKQPPSSDHSIILPGGEVFVEATTIDLRRMPTNDEDLLNRLKRKLSYKKHQALRDRPFIVALMILGVPDLFERIASLLLNRIWQPSRFRDFGGIFCIAPVSSELGSFRGRWVSNPYSSTQPGAAVHDLLSGRRCFHLEKTSVEVHPDEIRMLRHRVATNWHSDRSIVVPVVLIGGPLDGIRILLRPFEAGDASITYTWEISATTRSPGGKSVEIHPSGPIQINYGRVTDDLYQFTGFRVWLDRLRPFEAGSEYLPRLAISKGAHGVCSTKAPPHP